ncbi:DNA replication/repair protein RecF [Zhongshania marina]|uniref:DNA replication and repair protein RecF n=1 Tax=Zhongshania marina TaxID=2304603 RepID=A0ABX9W4Y7_9GAMM|nr:DNA replication/repair protein RecF [Zhongshania marina]
MFAVLGALGVALQLEKLIIHNFRNLRQVSLGDLREFNFIHGINGSGKTSILEAIHTLALTRSFRSRKIDGVISYGCEDLIVRGELSPSPTTNTPNTIIGVRRPKKGAVLVKVNGEKLLTAGQLAGIMPVQVINPASFELLEGSPSVRRQYLDWGVFHVKHSGFFEYWPRYRKALQQRNSLLRRGNIDASLLAPWDRELVAMGVLIHEARLKHFALLSSAFDLIYGRLLSALDVGQNQEGAPPLTIAMTAGWKDEELSLAESLQKNLSSDLRSGFTKSGPHRADIDLRVGRNAAGDVLSRGQIKTVVCALKLAQSKVLLDQGISTVFLIDDLAAELDERRCEMVFKELVALNVQVFASSVRRTDLNDSWSLGKTLKRFHVEHGQVSEC